MPISTDFRDSSIPNWKNSDLNLEQINEVDSFVLDLNNLLNAPSPENLEKTLSSAKKLPNSFTNTIAKTSELFGQIHHLSRFNLEFKIDKIAVDLLKNLSSHDTEVVIEKLGHEPYDLGNVIDGIKTLKANFMSNQTVNRMIDDWILEDPSPDRKSIAESLRNITGTVPIVRLPKLPLTPLPDIFKYYPKGVLILDENIPLADLQYLDLPSDWLIKFDETQSRVMPFAVCKMVDFYYRLGLLDTNQTSKKLFEEIQRDYSEDRKDVRRDSIKTPEFYTSLLESLAPITAEEKEKLSATMWDYQGENKDNLRLFTLSKEIMSTYPNLMPEYIQKTFPAIETFSDCFSLAHCGYKKFYEYLGFSEGYVKETNQIFITLPTIERVKERWANVVAKCPGIPMLDIVISDGIASDEDFIQTFLKHHILVSNGKEFVHDMLLHLYTTLGAVISRYANQSPILEIRETSRNYIQDKLKKFNELELNESEKKYKPSLLTLISATSDSLSAGNEFEVFGNEEHVLPDDLIVGDSDWVKYLNNRFGTVGSQDYIENFELNQLVGLWNRL